MSYQEAGFDGLEEFLLHVIPGHHRLADHAETVAHSKGLPQLVGPAGGMRLQGAKGSLLYWQHPMQLCLHHQQYPLLLLLLFISLIWSTNSVICT